MNKRQIGNVTCTKWFAGLLQLITESVQKISKFEKGVTRLKEVVDEIDEIAAQQETDLKGIAAEKDQTIDDMIALAVDISGAIHSYAKEVNDRVLLDKANYPSSAWEKMSEVKVIECNQYSH